MFFKKNYLKKSEDFGGPRCFYKYAYKNLKVIVIGERHHGKDCTHIPKEIAGQYIEYFLNFTNQCSQVKIFFEIDSSEEGLAREQEISRQSASTSNLENRESKKSFMDNINGIPFSQNVEKVCADSRNMKDKFFYFHLFLNLVLFEVGQHIKKIESEAAISEKEVIVSALQDEELMESFSELADEKCGKNYSLSEFKAFFKAEDERLALLEQTYKIKDERLGNYLAKCRSVMAHAPSLMEEMVTQYQAMRESSEMRENISLVNLCIETMRQEKTREIIIRLINVCQIYGDLFLDATLRCDLWEEFQTANEDEEEKVIVAIIGSYHASALLPFLNGRCRKVLSVDAETGKILLPEEFKDCLMVNRSEKRCSIM